MANKNVYFFQVDLFRSGEQLNYQEIGNIFKEIINKHAVDFGKYKSLDATPYEEEMHLMIDIYEYEDNLFFARMSKQKPSNSMVQHDYRTYKKEDVLPGNNENERGIEQYTFGLMNYQRGVFLLVSSQGAPNEKIINNILLKYSTEYSVELIPVPNARAIESIYEGEESEITKLEIEVPLPDLGTLENVFHWKEKELVRTLGERNLSASIVIKTLRRQSITRSPDETRLLMDVIKDGLPGYTKAKMKAKARNLKLRDYNFFDDKFSYPIDINDSNIKDGERIYYTVEELVDVYRRKMREAYNGNEKLLRIILGR